MVAPGVIYCHEWQGEPGGFLFVGLPWCGISGGRKKPTAPPKVWHLCNVGFTWPLLVVVDLRSRALYDASWISDVRFHWIFCCEKLKNANLRSPLERMHMRLVNLTLLDLGSEKASGPTNPNRPQPEGVWPIRKDDGLRSKGGLLELGFPMFFGS